jgi:hypothetical protein
MSYSGTLFFRSFYAHAAATRPATRPSGSVKAYRWYGPVASRRIAGVGALLVRRESRREGFRCTMVQRNPQSAWCYTSQSRVVISPAKAEEISIRTLLDSIVHT